MKPVNLAVIFDQVLHQGGGFQQALNAALVPYTLDPSLVSVSFYTTHRQNLSVLASHNILAKYIPLARYQLILAYLGRLFNEPYSYRFFHKIFPSRLERFLLSESIDLVYFLSPTSWAQDLDSLNYITTIWDTSHRDQPEFPEVRVNRQFEHRERIISSLVRRATAVLVDSTLGKDNLVARYSVDPARVGVVPFSPSPDLSLPDVICQSEQINVASSLGITPPYVFYPAQYWSHKNHSYIIRSIARLRSHGINLSAVFCGSDKGNLDFLKKVATDLGVSSHIRFLGFVDPPMLRALYRQSLALVMPSFFGPTNLPPLEAFSLGVPVVYSDLPGLSSQVGDAALLIDLSDETSLPDALIRLLESPELRQDLILRGRARFSQIDSNSARHFLTDVLLAFRSKAASWR